MRVKEERATFRKAAKDVQSEHAGKILELLD